MVEKKVSRIHLPPKTLRKGGVRAARVSRKHHAPAPLDATERNHSPICYPYPPTHGRLQSKTTAVEQSELATHMTTVLDAPPPCHG